MSNRQKWCDAYEEYWNEHENDGLSDKELDKRATEWADGCFERAQCQADMQREEIMENRV